MKVVRIIYRIISVVTVICIIIVTALALLLGISGINRDKPMSVFGFRSFIVLTGSMNPTFDAGSLIIIKNTPEKNLKVGDIITYRPIAGDDTLLTHRIVQVSTGDDGVITYITRGDANNMDDPNPVQPDSILGKTMLHFNGLGTFIVNLRTPLGLIVMIAVIIIVLFVLPYILDVLGGKKGSKMSVEENTEDTETDKNKTDNNGKSDG
ncbi:MAG: signal peptidase I [Oscillospiraceae bacterium]|nr:signal peptidase I [Oscillospiraceae bacterium]